ncbi:MAG: hypothetical protein B0D96_00750 [Candidatus Sedimenticola endophacoides]|nr:MAG: hypothetical protein B0D94_11545 [Candidatus Sedimenticola endophacoides]OQX38164.1 MAG: hypothetical protein B0D96_00750 [Candidatus Sedimenticola endophacoides]OQX38399.1 MAG: hypothetical protein B0D89_12765 [Candidatus Sedimenticola endophacoides]OQX47699.1 MAG: hypothetical protein B0D87_08905 [Candidatus Sedimenticola endophacoides]
MITPICLLAVLATALPSHTAQAISDPQYQSIRRLGELNAIALDCGHLEQVRQIKRALVNNLPKQRQLGEEFERITHQHFLTKLQQGGECPEGAHLARRVDEAIGQLEQAFHDSAPGGPGE